MDHQAQLLKSLEFFQDWSIIMLVLTVAAIGWTVASREKFSRLVLLRACLMCFGASTVFALFTLALVPLVAESLNSATRSIFAVRPSFDLLFGEAIRISWVRLTYLCWPQLTLFLAGIALYIWGTVERRHQVRAPGHAAAATRESAEPPARPAFNPNA